MTHMAISIKASDVSPSGQVVVIAMVSDNTGREKNFLSGQEVKFFLNGNRQDPPELTNEDGVAEKTLDIPVGSHIILVRTADGNEVTVKVLNKGISKKPARIKTRVDQLGPSKYQVTIQVLTEEGRGVENSVVRLIGSINESGFIDLDKTDENGVVSHDITVTEETKISIIVLGSSLNTWKNLYP